MKIVILSVAPGSGKSSVARLLASKNERAVNLHTDDFYRYISAGYVAPYLPEAHEQNAVIAKVMAACAAEYAGGGYTVYVDGIIGPWLLEPWRQAAQQAEVYYVILRPSLETAISRATARIGERDLTDATIVRHMWQQFADLGDYERNTIDTTKQTVNESAETIQKMISDGQFRLSRAL